MAMDGDLLPILKCDLQNPPAKDEYLNFLIGTAKEQIADKGITLNGSVSDIHLVVSWASWLYRKRATNEPMPKNLSYALHSRLVHEKGGCKP